MGRTCKDRCCQGIKYSQPIKKKHVRVQQRLESQSVYCLSVPPPGICIPSVEPPRKKNFTKLEQVQRRASRWITAKWLTDYNKWSKSYDQSKKELHWLSLEQRRTYLLLCEAYKIVNKQDSIEFAKYFTWNPCTDSRSHKLSIFCKHARTNIHRYPFFINSIYLWNSLPLYVVESTSLFSFKHKFKKIFYNDNIM